MHMMNSLAIMLAIFLIRPDFMVFGIPLGTLIPDLDIHLQRFRIGRHRKTLHNLFVPLFIAFIGVATSQSVLVYISIGVVVHLLADSLSSSGLYLLYPFVPRLKVEGFWSFTQPSGGKDEWEQLNNRLKKMTSQIIFLSLTTVEISLIVACRFWIRLFIEVFLYR